MTNELSRRSVVRGGGLMCVAGAAGYAVAKASPAAKEAGPGGAANGYGAATSGGAGGGGGTRLAELSAIPVGGGTVVDSARVVLVRSGETDVHGFSATCTHQGCTVDSVQDGVIGCPCHGSRFDATTGAVVSGPATRPLPKVTVEVRDGTVYEA